MILSEEYSQRYEQILIPLSHKLEILLKTYLKNEIRIDRISSRAKSLNSFLDKAAKIENGIQKYSDPINQIQDQIGARIITFYLNDISRIAQIVEQYFRPVESQTIVPDKENEFGYFGKHYILIIPDDIVTDDLYRKNPPLFFELQIKTLFQHAWSEAEHDLGYKPGCELTSDEKRCIAFTSAQAWGADRMFNDLFLQSLQKVNNS